MYHTFRNTANSDDLYDFPCENHDNRQRRTPNRILMRDEKINQYLKACGCIHPQLAAASQTIGRSSCLKNQRGCALSFLFTESFDFNIIWTIGLLTIGSSKLTHHLRTKISLLLVFVPWIYALANGPDLLPEFSVLS